MFLHQFEVQSAQQTVELAWQANNMDGLQQKYECCGKTSAQDYVHLRQSIPPSCYADLQQKPEHLFVEGCIEKLQCHYESDKRRFIIVSWVLVAFEVGVHYILNIQLHIEYINNRVTNCSCCALCWPSFWPSVSATNSGACNFNGQLLRQVTSTKRGQDIKYLICAPPIRA